MESVVVQIFVGGDGATADQNELADMTRRLQAELSELPTEGVQPVSAGAIPAAAKAIDALALGALAVKIAPTVLQAVIGLVKNWVERQRDERLTIKVVVGDRSIELAHAQRLSAAELAELARSLSQTLRSE